MVDNSIKIILKEELREALDDFCGSFGIRIAFFDAMINEVKAGLDQQMCKFCHLVRTDLGLRDKCLRGDMEHFHRAAATGKIELYHCHAGLLEAIKPVIIDDLLIGFIMMGQFRDRQELSVETPIGSVTKVLRAAFAAVPYYSPMRVRHICGLFSSLVDSSVRNDYYRIEGEINLLRIKGYIRENISRSISLDEVAAFLKCSNSTISHYVKKYTGETFKHLLIELKLAAVEKTLSVPGMTVRRAAAGIGYDDPYYFSRIFKKYRGFPPSALCHKK